MNLNTTFLYLFTFLAAFVLSLIFTPAARAAAILLNVFDHPSSSVKTHKEPVPYLGGVAIFLAFSLALLWLRILTAFPSGTLRSLRGILVGGAFIVGLGLVDDIRTDGLHYRVKFLFQITAACMIILFGIHVKFIKPTWVGLILSVIWVVGITNAFNLIDIMDGLASAVAVVSSLAFLFISLPTEEIYVNFAAAALAGAALGFLPYNVSKNFRVFMGDSGSLFLGFTTSSLALGTVYSETSELALLAPLLVLAVPIFDTVFVFILRIRRGMSPFMGSKDHFPLRLEILGWSRRAILNIVICLSLAFSLAAYIITRAPVGLAVFVFLLCAVSLYLFTRYLLKAKVQ